MPRLAAGYERKIFIPPILLMNKIYPVFSPEFPVLGFNILGLGRIADGLSMKSSFFNL
jgi:hypothetical protein